jgi:hypothetical protein
VLICRVGTGGSIIREVVQASRRRSVSRTRGPILLHGAGLGAVLRPAAEREVNHPCDCHCSRIPERTILKKLVGVLVFGCAYWRIADLGLEAGALTWLEQ